jgi:hypothetical protein
MSVYDLAITGGVWTDSPGAPTADQVVEEVQLILSHSNAKYLRDTLIGLIAEYEKEISPIPSPDLSAHLDPFFPAAIAALKSFKFK